MPNKPYTFENREYESNLTEFRLAKNITIRELCKLLTIHPMVYSGLNNGTISPIDRKGTTKDAAIKLAIFFEAELSDLWPRYFCSLPTNINIHPWDILNNFHPTLSTETLTPEEILIHKESLIECLKYMKKILKPRSYYILIDYFLLEKSSREEIAKKFNISITRTRQIFRHIFSKSRSKLNIGVFEELLLD
jgi:hypothetical protein